MWSIQLSYQNLILYLPDCHVKDILTSWSHITINCKDKLKTLALHLQKVLYWGSSPTWSRKFVILIVFSAITAVEEYVDQAREIFSSLATIFSTLKRCWLFYLKCKILCGDVFFQRYQNFKGCLSWYMASCFWAVRELSREFWIKVWPSIKWTEDYIYQSRPHCYKAINKKLHAGWQKY